MPKFCSYEGDEFPDGEFEFVNEHGTVHKRDPKHTTAGYLLSGSAFASLEVESREMGFSAPTSAKQIARAGTGDDPDSA